MAWTSVFKGLGKGLSNVGSSLSTWLAGTKWGNWLKLGAAGGFAYVVYDGWNSLVGSVSDATGLSEDNASTLIFVLLGFVAVYLLLQIMLPKDSGSVVIRNEGTSRVSRSGNGRRNSRRR